MNGHISFNSLALCATVALSGCVEEGRKVTAFSLLGMKGSELRPAAELPPAGYPGELWIDSHGCSFRRTGPVAEPNWVPQVDAARRQICDPTLIDEDAEIPIAEARPITLRTEVDPKTGLKTTYLPPIPIAPSYVRVGNFTDPAEVARARKIFGDYGFPIVDGATTPVAGRPTPVTLGPFETASALEDARAIALRLGFDGSYIYRDE